VVRAMRSIGFSTWFPFLIGNLSALVVILYQRRKASLRKAIFLWFSVIALWVVVIAFDHRRAFRNIDPQYSQMPSSRLKMWRRECRKSCQPRHRLTTRRLLARPSRRRPAMQGDDAFETEDGKARGILPKYCPDGYIPLLLLRS